MRFAAHFGEEMYLFIHSGYIVGECKFNYFIVPHYLGCQIPGHPLETAQNLDCGAAHAFVCCVQFAIA